MMDGEISGGELARILGVSRAAVWKAVESLRESGYVIDAASGRGYRLKPTDVLDGIRIEKYLSTPWRVETMPSATSTNDVAKERAASGHDFYAVAADTQTRGKGRLGRKFFSPAGAGLYLSAVVRPHLNMDDCGKITAFAAVAAAHAIEKVCGVKVDIKWVNDLYFEGRKLCGILTEGNVDFEGGSLEYAVIGIGINVAKTAENERPGDICVSLEEICGFAPDRCKLAAALLDELYRVNECVSSGEFLKEYRERNIVLGRTVTVNGKYEAQALAIDDDCSLIIMKDGERSKFAAGEVSLKL